MNKKQLLHHLQTEVYCRIRCSSIHGVGVYAIRTIPKGTNPFQQSKTRHHLPIKLEELKQLDPHVAKLVRDYYTVEGEEIFVSADGINVFDFSYFINHSDVPNVIVVDDGKTYLALRDIQVGEELCVNYKEFADWK